jgi:hypothetical protein|tara:strand:+ start:702 stop:821 length:120 start_codon:yes stop_codon:yes gene_type:complete
MGEELSRFLLGVSPILVVMFATLLAGCFALWKRRRQRHR